MGDEFYAGLTSPAVPVAVDEVPFEQTMAALREDAKLIHMLREGTEGQARQVIALLIPYVVEIAFALERTPRRITRWFRRVELASLYDHRLIDREGNVYAQDSYMQIELETERPSHRLGRFLTFLRITAGDMAGEKVEHDKQRAGIRALREALDTLNRTPTA